jgi:hypothetical protein
MHAKDHPFVGIIVVTLVVIIGFLTYSYTKNRESTAESTNPNPPAEIQRQEAALFNPLPINNLSFRATVIGTEGNNPVSAILEYDGQTNIQIEFLGGEVSSRYVITATDTYTCEDDSCVRGETNEVALPHFDPQQFIYSESDYDTFRDDKPVYLGQQECPAGSCHTWDVNNTAVRDSYILFIDTDTTRVNQVAINQRETNLTVVYDYRPVTIIPPEDSQALPSFN